MNNDQIEGKWTEIKGRMREAYGDLTDDEVEEAKGDRQKMAGLLQSKYGKAKSDAEREVDELLAKV